MSEGLRYNKGKPPLGLISPVALIELSRVLEFGAIKYAPNNWRKGLDQQQLGECIFRHLMEFMMGKNHDDETRCLIMAHIMCNAMFSIELMVGEVVKDSRFIYSDQTKAMFETLMKAKNPPERKQDGGVVV